MCFGYILNTLIVFLLKHPKEQVGESSLNSKDLGMDYVCVKYRKACVAHVFY